MAESKNNELVWAATVTGVFTLLGIILNFYLPPQNNHRSATPTTPKIQEIQITGTLVDALESKPIIIDKMRLGIQGIREGESKSDGSFSVRIDAAQLRLRNFKLKFWIVDPNDPSNKIFSDEIDVPESRLYSGKYFVGNVAFPIAEKNPPEPKPKPDPVPKRPNEEPSTKHQTLRATDELIIGNTYSVSLYTGWGSKIVIRNRALTRSEVEHINSCNRNGIRSSTCQRLDRNTHTGYRVGSGLKVKYLGTVGNFYKIYRNNRKQGYISRTFYGQLTLK